MRCFSRGFCFSVPCVRAFLLLLCLTAPVGLWARGYRIPLSRNDSARILSYDSLYAVHMGTGFLKEASRQLDAAAMIYWEHNQLPEAVRYFERSLELNEQLGNQNGIAGINSNLAFIYSDMGDYQRAFELFERTLVVRRAEGKAESIISALVNESIALNHLQRYTLSVERLEEALSISRESNDEVQMRSVYGMLAETYQKAGDAKKAMYYFEFYRTFNEHITQKEVSTYQQQLAQQRLEEENLRLRNLNSELEIASQHSQIQQQAHSISNLTTQQRYLLDSLASQHKLNALLNAEANLQHYKNKLLQEEVKRQRLARVALVLLLLFVVLILVAVSIILRNRTLSNRKIQAHARTIERQNAALSQANLDLKLAHEQLQAKNNDILASVRYAKKIQDAVLTQSVPLDDLFPQSFVFARPCQIVSGDFHFFRRLPDGRALVVVADCTGHGVPGALLTILGSLTIDRAIYDHRVTTIAGIVDELDQAFSLLNVGQEVVSHSMDLCAAIYDYRAHQLIFGGAVNGLLLVNSRGADYYRGSRFYVGHQNSRYPLSVDKVEEHVVTIEEPTWCYMCSDGLGDQFNPDRVRFSSSRLRDLLRKLSSQSAQQQQQQLSASMEQWQAGAEQIDDMLLVGYRLT